MFLALKEIINLSDENEMIKASFEEALSNFKCDNGEDNEDFLKTKAINFEKQSISRTFIDFDEVDGTIIGFISLAIKVYTIDSNISKTLRKKITKSNDDIVAAYLIGQIAKASNVKDKKGDDYLKEAIARIKIAQEEVGGRLVYLDCKNEDKLINFYTKNNFQQLTTEPDESGYIKMYSIL